jgi:hypothetical protein
VAAQVLGGDRTQLLDEPEGAGDQSLVQRDAHPPAGLSEVQDPFVAGIAGLPEQQALHAELDPLGLPGLLGDVGRTAPLDVDRSHRAAHSLEDVDPGGQAEVRRRQQQRPGCANLTVVG